MAFDAWQILRNWVYFELVGLVLPFALISKMWHVHCRLRR